MTIFNPPFGARQFDPKEIPVPNTDGTDNDYTQDVIGNKEDKSFSNGIAHPSLVGHLKAGYYHVHDSAKVWPTGVGADSDKGADPVILTAASGTPWLHGDKIEVLPSDTIAKWFDIHWLVIGTATQVDDYEIRMYKGEAGSEVEIGRVAFSRGSNQDRASVYIPIQVPPQEKNTRISASLACGDGDGASCGLKFYYHTYPDMS